MLVLADTLKSKVHTVEDALSWAQKILECASDNYTVTLVEKHGQPQGRFSTDESKSEPLQLDEIPP